MEDYTPKALSNAKKLRRNMSLPEVLLWNKLRGKPMGMKFRNQHPIDNFVVDFFCASKQLAVEIDGIAHDMGNRPVRDALRDELLGKLGVNILRVPAADVLRNVDETAEAIVRYCAAIPPPTRLRRATSPSGGGFLGSF